MLDVERRDDVDAGVEQLLDVLPALLVAAAGHVGVGQLVDEHPFRAAGEDGVDVHLLERRAAVGRSTGGGSTSRSPICFGGERVGRASRRSRRRRRGRAPAARRPSLSMANGLADARARRRGRRAGCRASPRHHAVPRRPTDGCTGPSEFSHRLPRASRARFSSSTLTPGSPRNRGRGQRCGRRPARAPCSMAIPRAVGDRGACSRALATEMCGSRPEAEAVTASTGTGVPSSRPFSSR